MRANGVKQGLTGTGRFGRITDMKTAYTIAAALAASAVSAVRADSRMEPAEGEAWPYAVVVSKAADGDPAWRAVADALAAKYAKPPFSSSVVVESPSKAADALRAASPRYVAFVVKPEEAGAKTVYRLHAMMKSLDDDPYYDAAWGIVTGPTPESAMRLATASDVHPRSALSTTGIDFRPYDDATTISDAYAPGTKREEYMRPDVPVAIVERRGGSNDTTRIVRGDTTHEFVAAWNSLDPELLVTSAHASQRNLEMPFSTGNIVPRGGALCPMPRSRLIDYSTGQAAHDAGAIPAGVRLSVPKRNKIWIAAGNCLIADYKDNDSMAAAMIGYGRVVQFMGYVKTTWFGEIGWETLAQFVENGASVGEAWHFAGQNLERKLALMERNERDRNYQGRVWDRNATALWGDPALDASLEDGRFRRQARLTGRRTGGGILLSFEALEDLEAREDKVEDVHVVHPHGIILPRAPEPYKAEPGSGLGVFAADDFALVTSWPAMKKGEKAEVLLKSPGGR